MSNLEILGWTYFLNNESTREEEYLMQIAQSIDGVLNKKKDLSKYKITYKRAKKKTREQIISMAKSIWKQRLSK